MYTLFISTFDKTITIGLLKNGEVLEKSVKESKKSHSEYVMSMIDNILNNNNIETSYLNEIIVVNGPGSFTGVRIGVTIAKTLAYTLNIPIKSITSLLAIAVGITNMDKKIVTISDNKGKYVGYFNDNNELMTDYMYLKNSEFSTFISGKSDYLINSDDLDLSKIYVYLKNIEPLNPHMVNPIYVKGIEVLNGK